MGSRLVFASAAVAVLVSSPATAATMGVRVGATPAPVSCAIPKPCATFTNTNAGPAIEAVGTNAEAGLGISSGGAGLIGLSGSGNFIDAGVDGESYDASGNDAGGVFGADYFANGVAPEYGAVGVGAPYGLLGLGANSGTSFSAQSIGVLGQDDYGSVNNNGDVNVGVAGQSTVGTGLLGESNTSPQLSLFGDSPIGVYGVAGTAAGTPNGNAFAFVGETNSFGLDIHQLSNNDAVYVISPGSYITGTGGTGSFSISDKGSESLSGTLTTSKGTYVRTTGASGVAMREYGARTTAPQVEDVGEGQLASGRGYVTIDARLGDTIDRRAAYHVFLTPEGDCKGLYVTLKTSTGFAVRELQGGRSSLAFEYRIVAKPVDEDGTRLAIEAPLAKPLGDGLKIGRNARRSAPAPLSPMERLKRHIGTQAYAQMMLQFNAKRQALAR